jgi:hypothetical protein
MHSPTWDSNFGRMVGEPEAIRVLPHLAATKRNPAGEIQQEKSGES